MTRDGFLARWHAAGMAHDAALAALAAEYAEKRAEIERAFAVAVAVAAEAATDE